MDAEKVTVQQLAEALDRWAPWAGGGELGQCGRAGWRRCTIFRRVVRAGHHARCGV